MLLTSTIIFLTNSDQKKLTDRNVHLWCRMGGPVVVVVDINGKCELLYTSGETVNIYGFL